MRIILLFFGMMIALGAFKVQAASVCAKKVCVDVEVVIKDEDLRRGLQGREGLEDHHGMLFVFKNDGLQSFWMKDMKFAIDMIWIDAKRRIVTIAPSRFPCIKEPCEVYAPTASARYVLEVSSGYALKHHFKEGDGLLFKNINLE